MYEILYTVYPHDNDDAKPYSLPRFIIRAANESHARDEADRIVHGSVSNPQAKPSTAHNTHRTIHVREIL